MLKIPLYNGLFTNSTKQHNKFSDETSFGMINSEIDSYNWKRVGKQKEEQ